MALFNLKNKALNRIIQYKLTPLPYHSYYYSYKKKYIEVNCRVSTRFFWMQYKFQLLVVQWKNF